MGTLVVKIIINSREPHDHETLNPICRLFLKTDCHWPVNGICGIVFNRLYRLEGDMYIHSPDHWVFWKPWPKSATGGKTCLPLLYRVEPTAQSTYSVCPSSELGLSQPLSRQRVFPSPQKQGEGGTLACGWGESQFRRGAYTMVLFII